MLCFVKGDRYDEDPRPRNEGRLDDLEDWDKKKSVATEALDKVKDFWNRAHGRRGIDDASDYK